MAIFLGGVFSDPSLNKLTLLLFLPRTGMTCDCDALEKCVIAVSGNTENASHLKMDGNNVW